MISGNVFHWYVKFYHKKRSVSSSELTVLFLFVRELFHSPIGYSDRELQSGFMARIKLVRPEHSTNLLSDLARKEFCKRWYGEPVRSVNVTAGKISPAGHEQLELFFDGDERKHSLDAAVDRLRDRSVKW